MSAKYYYMMGLPASGKTTFLAAFTYMLMEHTEEVCLHMNPTDVQEGLTEEFNKEIERWASFQPLNHTRVSQVHKMKYILHDAEETQYIFDVPDRSGETFHSIIRDRYVDESTQEDWLRADEILFFVNFDKMDIGDKEELLTEMPAAVQEVLAEQGDGAVSEESETEKPIFPSQYALVELLQILRDIRKAAIKIKFIISAWDRVRRADREDEVILPEKVFRDTLPLVYQFVSTNMENFSVQYWGVSAQGSNLDNEDEIEQMSYDVEAMHRVQVVEPSGIISFDLSKIFLY